MELGPGTHGTGRGASADDAQLVGALAMAFAAAYDPRQVHEALLAFIRTTTSMNSLFIASFDPTTQLRTCRFAFSDGEEQDATGLPPAPLNDNHASRALREARTILVADFDEALHGARRTDVGTDVDARLPQTAIVVPMVAHERPLGYLEIQSCEPDAFEARDVAMLESAAQLAALAIENLALREGERHRFKAVERRLESQAVARALVRKMLTRLARQSHLPAQTLRDLGRELGRGANARDLADALPSYTLMGLGELRVEPVESGPFRIVGHDLLEHTPGATRPTCHLTLGFLEGAAEAATGRAALGTEVRCQSQGHDACHFVVAMRG